MKKALRFGVLLLMLGLAHPSYLMAQLPSFVAEFGDSGSTYGEYDSPIGSWGYMETQMIYGMSRYDLPNGGTITEISYYCDYTAGDDWDPDDITIYMGTYDGLYSSYEDAVDVSSLTEVFSGQLVQPKEEGWWTITLDTPYEYNGVGNLVVYIIRDDNGSGVDLTFLQTETDDPTNQMMRYDAGDDWLETYYYANARFTVTPHMAPFKPVAFAVTDVTATTATLAWTPSSYATADGFRLSYAVRGSDSWSTPIELDGAVVSTTLENLEPGTRYDVRIQAVYGDETSAYLTASVATLCGGAYSIPYNDAAIAQAQSQSSYSAAAELPLCWDFLGLSDNPATLPHAWVNTPTGSWKVIDIQSSNAQAPVIAILPPIDGDLNNALFSFINETNQGSRMEYGYITDASDAATFVSLGNVYVDDKRMAVDLSQTGVHIPSGARLALRITALLSIPVHTYIGYVSVTPAPLCKAPRQIAIDTLNLTQTSARLSWLGTLDDGDHYRLRYAEGDHQGDTLLADGHVLLNYGDIAGLTNAKYYKVHVDKYCASTGGYSRVTTFRGNLRTKGVISAIPNNSSYGYVDAPSEGFFGRYTDITAIPYDHYHFDHWTGAAGLKYTPTVSAQFGDGSGKYYAHFVADEHSLTVVSNNDSYGSVNDVDGTYSYGNTVLLSATPNSGYHFLGWSDGNTGNPYNYTVKGDAALTAYFASTTDALVVATLNDATLGSVSVSPSGVVPVGTTVTITVTVDDPVHYDFSAMPTNVVFQETTLGTYTAQVSAPAGGIFVAGYILPKDYLLTIDVDSEKGHTLGATSGIYSYGATVSVTAYAGNRYHFGGWQGDVTGTDARVSIVMDGDKTIAPLFEKDSVTIAVAMDNALGTVSIDDTNSVVASKSVAVGDEVTLYARAAAHATFVDWVNASVEEDYTFHAYGSHGQTITYTARFTPTYYHVATAVAAGQESWGTVTGGGDYVHGDVTTLQAYAATHYHFVGWRLQGGDTYASTDATYDHTVDQGGVYEAVFAPDPVVVTTIADAAKGSISLVGDQVYGGTITVTVDTLVGWSYEDCADAIGVAYPASVGQRTFELTLTEDITIEARFVQTEYRITVTAVDGSIEGGDYDALHHYGDVLNFTAVLDPQKSTYVCHWNDADSTVGLTLTGYVVKGPAALVATFIDPYDKVLTVEYGEGGTAGADAAAYLSGAMAIARATADEHYRFDHWESANALYDGSVDNPLLVTMDASYTVRAVFAKKVYHVGGIANVDTLGFVRGGAAGCYPDSVVLIAVPAAHCHFTGWSHGPLTDSIKVPFEGDHIYTANFEQDSFTVALAAVDAQLGTAAINNEEPSHRYVYGHQLVLEAHANAGVRFASWSGLTDAPLYHYTVTGDAVIEALFDSIEYSVAVSVNDAVMGSAAVVPQQPYYRYQQEVVLSAEVSDTNLYKFLFWEDGNSDLVRNVTITDDVALRAYFGDRDRYSLVAVSNNDEWGSVSGSLTNAVINTVATLTATPASDHHVFVGWSDGNDDNPREVVVDGDRSLMAIFALRDYAVSYVSDDDDQGSVSATVAAGSYPYGTIIGFSARPAVGCEFVRWEDNLTAATRIDTVTDAIAHIAYFDSIDYTVSVAVNDAGMGHVEGLQTQYRYGDVVSFTAVVDDAHKYRFVGWSDGETALAHTPILVDGDLDIEARFDYNLFDFDYAASGNGYVAATAVAGSYPYGTVITLVAHAMPHHHFVEWSNGMTESTLAVTLTDDTTLTATFAADVITLTVSSADPEQGSVSGSGSYAYRDLVAIEAVPAVGHHFVQWSDGITEASRLIYVEYDSNLVATFEIDTFYVATRVNNAALGTVTPGGWYRYGDSVTVVAVAAAHVDFVGFNGESDGRDTIGFRVSKDTTLVAYFRHQYLDLLVSSDHGTVVATVNDAVRSTDALPIQTIYDDSVVLVAQADEHYDFDRWELYNVDYTTTYNEVIHRDTIQIPYYDGDDLMERDSVVYDTVYEPVVTTNTTLIDSYATDTIAFRIVAHRMAVAYFTPHVYTVSIVDYDATAVAVAGAGSYAYGETVTLSATAADGYRFVAWVDADGATLSEESNYSFAIDADMVVIPVVEAIVGIDDAEAHQVEVYATGDMLHILGADQQQVWVFDVVGRQVSHLTVLSDHHSVALPASGIYLVKVGNEPARRISVVR